MLRIPKGARVALAILREMPGGIFQSLLLEIERSPASVPSVSNLSADDGKQVMTALNWMYGMRAYADVPLEEFVTDVCEALVEHDELKSEGIPDFRERLTKLLSIDALDIVGKASALLNEHEHLFCSARIITDARPVYGKSVSESPAAMVITHILKIDYHGASGQLHEIYLGIGSNGIEELRNSLDRAGEKEKSLRAAFEMSKLKFIDPEGD